MSPTPPQRLLQSAPGPIVAVDGREYVYFGGTGYLGLQSHPDVIEAGCRALRDFGLHAATSRAMYGTSPPLLAAEAAIARLFGVDAAMFFASGYAGAAVLVRALHGSFDFGVLDSAAHYSVVDAFAAAGVPTHQYAHADPDALAAVLARELARSTAPLRPLVATDGVFALRGEVAPLTRLIEVLREVAPAGATLLIDDAHGVGALGLRGRGTLEQCGIDPNLVNRAAGSSAEPFRIVCNATASKALGGYGGFVAGERAFIEGLRARSHWFDGATPPPAPVAAATATAIHIAMREPERRERLWSNAKRLRLGLAALGFDVDPAVVSPVCGLELPAPGATFALHEALRSAGYLVPFVASYSGSSTQQDGTLRIASFATHETSQIDGLLEAMRRHC